MQFNLEGWIFPSEAYKLRGKFQHISQRVQKRGENYGERDIKIELLQLVLVKQHNTLLDIQIIMCYLII